MEREARKDMDLYRKYHAIHKHAIIRDFNGTTEYNLHYSRTAEILSAAWLGFIMTAFIGVVAGPVFLLIAVSLNAPNWIVKLWWCVGLAPPLVTGLWCAVHKMLTTPSKTEVDSWILDAMKFREGSGIRNPVDPEKL
jgi:hypothetical protein